MKVAPLREFLKDETLDKTRYDKGFKIFAKKLCVKDMAKSVSCINCIKSLVKQQ